MGGSSQLGVPLEPAQVKGWLQGRISFQLGADLRIAAPHPLCLTAP